MAVFQYDSSSLGRSVKVKRRLLLAAIAAGALLVICLGIALSASLIEKSRLASRGVLPKTQVQRAWSAKDYQLVFDSCRAALENKPLDAYYLTFHGFSSFYLGVSQISDEEKGKFLDESVASLRKALLRQRAPMKREIHYILGKAYFHKGRFYLDQAAKYLELALSERMRADDIDEYLALTHFSLGNEARSLEYFERALSARPTDQLYIAMASALIKNGQGEKGAELLTKAIASTKDIAAEHKARFMLCELYILDGALDAAEAEAAAVLEGDSQSAEAHYQMGIIQQKRGDNARARAEWRKAVSLDPMHQASRLKLSEKTKSPEAKP